MKPVRELAAHARGLRGIFCDVDDTLTRDGALVPAAYEAIARAKRAGLRVVPVTGRPAGWAAVLATTWPIDAAIAENGAVFFRRAGRAVTPVFWDPDEVRQRNRAQLDAIRTDVLQRIPQARLADDQWLRLCDLAFDVGETQSLEEARVQAIAHAVEAHGALAVRSTVHVHAILGSWDKARMATRLARELWNEDLDQTRGAYLFVGDSPNDQTCFAYFPLSVGVANVARWMDVLASPPGFVADGTGGDGFAEVVDVVLAAR
jgi:HAD superfamily hydrolase (TIGR01484 family)